jgi:transcriptional regulator with XRE-family HTH domain
MKNDDHFDYPSLELEERADRTIGRRLSVLRRRAGLSIEELSHRAKLPPEELRDHERGLIPIPLSRAPILCEAMGCPLASLGRTAERAIERHRKTRSRL